MKLSNSIARRGTPATGLLVAIALGLAACGESVPETHVEELDGEELYAVDLPDGEPRRRTSLPSPPAQPLTPYIPLPAPPEEYPAGQSRGTKREADEG